jgi:hypothetical protein
VRNIYPVSSTLVVGALTGELTGKLTVVGALTAVVLKRKDPDASMLQTPLVTTLLLVPGPVHIEFLNDDTMIVDPAEKVSGFRCLNQ